MNATSLSHTLDSDSTSLLVIRDTDSQAWIESNLSPKTKVEPPSLLDPEQHNSVSLPSNFNLVCFEFQKLCTD
jgi:hypothetical protein